MTRKVLTPFFNNLDTLNLFEDSTFLLSHVSINYWADLLQNVLLKFQGLAS